MSDSEETVVTVEHTDEPAPETTPTVIVADTGDDNSNDLEIGAALGALSVTVEGLGQAVAALNERVDALASRAEYTEQTAETAIDIAASAAEEVTEVTEAAEEIAEETAQETAADEVEQIIQPDREHPIWRNPIRLRRGADA